MSEIEALAVDTPYRYEEESLDDVFDRGDSLEVAIFGFTRAQIAAAFPGLAGRSTTELVEVLRPELGPPGPGRYAPPEPHVILTAVLEPDTEPDFSYLPINWDAARDREDLQFGFRLAGNLACPPIGSPMRVFNREDPSAVCIYTRNDRCEWTAGECSNAAVVFGGPVPSNEPIQETPSRSLIIGTERCDPLGEIAPGETRAWLCGDRTVAAQEEVLSAAGEPWRMEQGTPLSTPDLAAPHTFARSVRGVLIAAGSGASTNLHRLAVMSGVANYQSFETPVVDGLASTHDPAPASSADGIVVRATRDFDARVGVSNLQCFVTLAAGRQEDSALIADKPSLDTIRLAAPGLGGPLSDTVSWRIVGDPGPDFLTSPPVVDVVSPGVGTIDRLSRSPPGDVVLLHGSTRTFRLLRLGDRFPNDLNYFTCAVEIPQPPGLVGEIVAGSSALYAVSSDSIEVLDFVGAQIDRLGTDRTFVASDRIDVVEGPGGGDHIVVWNSDRLHLFDRAGTEDRTETVDGRIVAVLDGPIAVFLPDGESHTVALLNLARDEETRIAVPPFTETVTAGIEIAPAAAIESAAGRIMLGYTDGNYAGVIDVRTGLSQAIPLSSGGSVTAVFEDDAQDAVWAVVESPAQPSQADLLRSAFPAP